MLFGALQTGGRPPTAKLNEERFRPPPEMENGAAQRVSETVREAASATSDAASGAADAIKDRVGEGVTYARESLDKLAGAVPRKEAPSDLLERQPLVHGAIGLAMVLPSPVPSLRLMSKRIGSASDSRAASRHKRDSAQQRPPARSAERSGLPEMETVRSEPPGYGAHLAFVCFQRDLLGEHNVSDRQSADRHEAQPLLQTAFLVDLAHVH
jgi:hypothetical protein